MNLYPFQGHCKQSNTVNTGLMLAPETYTASDRYMYTGQERGPSHLEGKLEKN